MLAQDDVKVGDVVTVFYSKTLKDSGKVTNKTPTDISIKVKMGVLTIPRTLIKKIVNDDTKM